MPLYEYQCSKCGKVFEKMQKFSDTPLTQCECPDQGPVERMISAPQFQFKGSGWYITDYAKGSGGGNGKSDSKSDSGKTETKTETKTESKPAAPSSSGSKSE